MEPRYLEEWTVGDRIETATVRVTRDAVTAFAALYDPQPFHLDEAAGAASIFGRLAASGWHTASYAMRLIVDTGVFAHAGLVGLGVDELRWLRPVHPGDTLRVEMLVEAITPSREKPRGVVRFRNTTTNQDGAVVMTHVAAVLVPSRPAREPDASP